MNKKVHGCLFSFVGGEDEPWITEGKRVKEERVKNWKWKMENDKSCKEGEEEERDGCWKGKGVYAKSRSNKAVRDTIFVDGDRAGF